MDTYDPGNGLVFKETILPYKRKVPWQLQTKAERLRLSERRRDVNMRSLQDLCMKTVIRHANSLLPETLESIPHPIATKVWSAIRREDRESFHVWTAFVGAGVKMEACKHFLKIDCELLRPIIDTFSKFSSAGCGWLVDLTLADVNLSAAELKEVSRIVNLRFLHVHNSRQHHAMQFDDRIIRAWSTRARDEGAFGHFQALSVDCAPRISSQIFEHLSSLPKMRVLVSRATAIGPEGEDLGNAETYGWSETQAHVYTDIHSPSGSLKIAHRHFTPAQLSVDYVRGVAHRICSGDAETTTDVPILDAVLGNIKIPNVKKQQQEVLCFEKDPGFVLRRPVDEPNDNARVRKRRKMNAAKGADFASMLCER